MIIEIGIDTMVSSLSCGLDETEALVIPNALAIPNKPASPCHSEGNERIDDIYFQYQLASSWLPAGSTAPCELV
jgi:hypothetical protein